MNEDCLDNKESENEQRLEKFAMDKNDPSVAAFLEDNTKLNAEVYEQKERIRQKAIYLQELLEKQI